jgi:predicted nucleic acid-binding protein
VVVTRFAIDPVTFVLVARSEQEIAGSHHLVAPNSLRTRALELLLAEVRGGQLDDRAALQIHERLTGVKVRLLGDRVSRRVAWDLARENGWDDLGDSEYIAVARLQADALVTTDRSLAAKAEGLVPIASVEELFAA